MPDDTKRRKSIDDAIDGADNEGAPRAEAPKEENPYPKGSARAKYWARRQADAAERQNTDSNN